MNVTLAAHVGHRLVVEPALDDNLEWTTLTVLCQTCDLYLTHLADPSFTLTLVAEPKPAFTVDNIIVMRDEATYLHDQYWNHRDTGTGRHTRIVSPEDDMMDRDLEQGA